ncbi:hypothetical protein FDECE_10572 [Fusarium decemcellulare]|nr:hypothetical protein FDECE_10572 [Fusarium decemcellulare]
MDLLPALVPPCPDGPYAAQVIAFRHPAYSRFERELLRFNLVDGPAKDGLDYDFALICCGIVTGNTWETGWFATGEANGQYSRVERPTDGLLRGHTYYYFVGDHEPTHRYPVIPSFHHWRFPHGELPELWARLEIPPGPQTQATRRDEAVLTRDVTCRITAHKGAREVAHLVPLSEGYWFIRNGMRRYCLDQLNSISTYDTNNMLLLRRDLHFLFDHHRFVFATKRNRSDAVQLVLHVLNHERADELVNLYHNRLTQALCGVSVEFIFARLAWTLFTSTYFPAFDGMARMAVQLFNPEKDEVQNDDLYQQDIRSRMKLFKAYSRSQSRSNSPMKRARDETVEDEEMSEWNLDPDGDGWPTLLAEESPRGRCRERSWDTHKQESLPELVGSTASPIGATSSPRSIHPSENLSGGKGPAVVDPESTEVICAKAAEIERSAGPVGVDPGWQLQK